LSEKSSIIQKNFKKQFGQRFLLGKLHLNQHTEGNEVSLILTYHSHSVIDNIPKDTKEDVAYSLYFYSLHKIQVEELKNELVFVQTIGSEIVKNISSNILEEEFINCPQFSVQPKIDFPSRFLLIILNNYFRTKIPLPDFCHSKEGLSSQF